MCLNKKVPLGDDIFLQLFHGEIVLCTIPSDHVNFAERASANYLDKFEIIQADFLVRPEEVLTSFAVLWPIVIAQHIVVNGLTQYGRVASFLPLALDRYLVLRLVFHAGAVPHAFLSYLRLIYSFY